METCMVLWSFTRKLATQESIRFLGYEAMSLPKAASRKKHLPAKKRPITNAARQNRTGFRNLVKLASAGSLEGFYFKPRIDKETDRGFSEGSSASAGCVSVCFHEHFEGRRHRKMPCRRRWKSLAGSQDFRQSLFHRDHEQWRRTFNACRCKCRRYRQPYGTDTRRDSDAHYVDKEDADTQDVLLCHQHGKFRTMPTA